MVSSRASANIMFMHFIHIAKNEAMYMSDIRSDKFVQINSNFEI